MADSFNKKDREKRKKKRRQDKAERKEQRKQEGTKPLEFMYVDEDGNLSPTPPDPTKKKEISLDDINVSTPKKGELEEEDLIKKGRVKFFNEEKGYGFIIEKDTKVSHFVHSENLEEPIKENDKVTFEAGTGPKGPIALNVKLVKL